jgi:hypothetical protein
MVKMGTIQRLENWYKAQCNGHWEHGRGIRICTLDNPGWSVTIDLSETTEANQRFEAIKIEVSETDWLQCWKQGTEFEGRGDASKLEAILGRFLTLVGY